MSFINMTNVTIENFTVTDGSGPMLAYRLELGLSVQIGLYSAIFLLAVLGNVLVILTLVQNQGMRTITNLFLLNLAISDLLMGVVCIPFTLVSTVLKDFVFGAVMCKIIPFLQAVSVSVSAWTLVAISVERYYAICHPLTSRRWQTLSHAYKIICVVWVVSLFCMSPIALVNVLLPIRQTGRHKCRERWPDSTLEKTYNVFLDIILLVLPLVIMTVKYSLITRTLWQASGNEASHEQSSMLATSGVEETCSPKASPSKPRIMVTLSHSQGHGNGSRAAATAADESSSSRWKSLMSGCRSSSSRYKRKNDSQSSSMTISSPNNLLSTLPRTQNVSGGGGAQNNHVGGGGGGGGQQQLLRRCNVAVSLRRKKRVIQMLGVVVAEFFICWTPIYVMNTWYLFYPKELYSLIGPLGVSLIQVLAYTSSCSNPITYCFMNRGFRMSFFHVFGCHCVPAPHRRQSASTRNDSLRLNRCRSVYSGSYSNNSNNSNSKPKASDNV